MALAMIAAGASGGEIPAPTTTSHLRRDSSLLERKTTKLHTFLSFQKPLELPNKLPALPKDKAAALAAARDLERNAKIGSGRGLSAVAMATSAQRRSGSDMDRVKRWNVSEAMGVAWMECLQPVDTKSVYGKDFNAISCKFIAVLGASFALARNIQRTEVDRRSQVDLITRHRLDNGVHSWRKLLHCLIKTKCLFCPSGDQLCKPAPVFWKLDFMESSARMRRCVRRNYKGSDHFGADANFEDHNKMKEQENGIHSSNAPILAAKAITVEAVNEDDEQGEIDNLDGRTSSEEQSGENQPHLSETADQSLQTTAEFGKAQVSCEPDLGESSSAVAPGYVPSVLDERIVLELPSLMVLPLRVIHGTFETWEQPLHKWGGWIRLHRSERRRKGSRLDDVVPSSNIQPKTSP